MAGFCRIWIPGFGVNEKKPLYEATQDLIVSTWINWETIRAS
jgi:hypothetical protein